MFASLAEHVFAGMALALLPSLPGGAGAAVARTSMPPNRRRKCQAGPGEMAIYTQLLWPGEGNVCLPNIPSISLSFARLSQASQVNEKWSLICVVITSIGSVDNTVGTVPSSEQTGFIIILV